MGASRKTGTAKLSEIYEFSSPSVYCEVHVTQSLVFYVVIFILLIDCAFSVDNCIVSFNLQLLTSNESPY